MTKFCDLNKYWFEERLATEAKQYNVFVSQPTHIRPIHYSGRRPEGRAYKTAIRLRKINMGWIKL